MFFNNEIVSNNLDDDFNKKKFNIKFIIIGLFVVIIGIIVGLFMVKKPSNKEYFLTLNGDSNIVVKQNSIYEDAGYEAYDSDGNDISDKVNISGRVNTDIVGEYTITYNIDNITVTRYISVVADTSQVTYLILKGQKVIYLKVGETYTEPGYLVMDNSESDLNSKVQIEGNVNTNIASTYKLIYSVTNKSGVTTKEERTVIVTSNNMDISYNPIEVTNKNVTISINSKDNYFDYIILPDGKKSTMRNNIYEVSKNGNYKFVVYSKDGSYKEQVVNISNIDKVAPTGSCNATRKNGQYNILVNVKDDKNIANYKYYINNNLVHSGDKNQLSYQSDITNNIYVMVTDSAGNSGKITCSVEKTKVYDMEMHFIDVGREDAILIRTPEVTIFIDGGLYKNKDVILPYLKSLGIKKFDAIIGSHLHNNHIQAQGPIIDNYSVGKVYYGQDLHSCNPTYCNSSGQKYVLEAIKKHNVPQIIMKAGDRVTIGDIVIDCYAPIKFQTKSQNKYAENYNSLNFILTYGQNKFMFTGDHMQSNEILNKYKKELMKVDFLKYPHHGQANINNELIEAMSPNYVMVTNTQIDSLKIYSAYSYLSKINSKIYYSGRDKHVLVKSDGKNITIKTNVNPNDYKK